MTELFDANPSDSHDEDAAHEHHGASFRLYWLIALVLGVITLIEVYLAEWLPGRVPGGTVAGVMLLLSIFKAVLVAAFYMHLRYEKRVLTIIFLIPFFLVSLLAITIMGDVPR